MPEGTGTGDAAALLPVLVSETLPSQSNLLTICFSMSSTILASNLHICWDTVGCSLCSSEDQLGIPPVHRGKWAPLPSTSLPPSKILSLFYLIYCPILVLMPHFSIIFFILWMFFSTFSVQIFVLQSILDFIKTTLLNVCSSLIFVGHLAIHFIMHSEIFLQLHSLKDFIYLFIYLFLQRGYG